MKFEQQLLPYQNIQDVYVDGKRFYETPAGKFKSVTTIIGEKLPKDGIIAWQERVGEEEAKRVLKEAGQRGTRIHDLCERYVRGEDIKLSTLMPPDAMSFKELRSVLDKHLETVYGLEYPLYSPLLCTAGRTDLIGKYDGYLSIIDFKTARGEKREDWILGYFLQATCYAMMLEERFGYQFEVPQIVIIISSDKTGLSVFVKETCMYRDQVTALFTS